MAKKKEILFEFPHPMDNDCLIGHGETLQTFLDAWNNRNEHPIHPVWMLCGPRGIGKATLAYKIAKMVSYLYLHIFKNNLNLIVCTLEKSRQIEEHQSIIWNSYWLKLFKIFLFH